MNAHIICDRYLSDDGNAITIGGMQTYFTNLSDVLVAEGYAVNIHHLAKCDFMNVYKGLKVHGYKYKGKQHSAPKYLFDKVKNQVDKQNDIIIFGSEMWIVKNEGYNTIAIQHGIPWDIPCHQDYRGFKYWLYYIYKAYKAFLNIRKANMVSNLVCVDYNYINWYRSQTAFPRVKLHCIPNFSEVPTQVTHSIDDRIRIIFARRLWEYRGTRIFYEAIERILKEFDNVLVTIAGDGPDEIWLKDRLGKNQNVEFICYSSHESLLIHSNKQIAVIPTVGSEGTSLSLLEAMASKCAVICTDVGGLTNVIIDGYNGIIVPAGEPNALYEAIKNLIIDETLRENVANMGYETVATSFSLSKWKSAWAQKIKLISGQC